MTLTLRHQASLEISTTTTPGCTVTCFRPTMRFSPDASLLPPIPRRTVAASTTNSAGELFNRRTEWWRGTPRRRRVTVQSCAQFSSSTRPESTRHVVLCFRRTLWPVLWTCESCDVMLSTCSDWLFCVSSVLSSTLHVYSCLRLCPTTTERFSPVFHF